MAWTREGQAISYNEKIWRARWFGKTVGKRKVPWLWHTYESETYTDGKHKVAPGLDTGLEGPAQKVISKNP